MKKIITLMLLICLFCISGCNKATETIPTTMETTVVTSATISAKKYSKYSCYIDMNKMTIQQMVDNIWKLGYFPDGMTKADYVDRMIYSEEDVTKNIDNDFFWEFTVKDSKAYINYIDVYLNLSDNTDKIEYTDKTCVNVAIVFKDENQAKELFSTALSKYQKEKFSVKSNEYSEKDNTREVILIKDKLEYTISIYDSTVTLKIPAYKNVITAEPAT